MQAGARPLRTHCNHASCQGGQGALAGGAHTQGPTINDTMLKHKMHALALKLNVREIF